MRFEEKISLSKTEQDEVKRKLLYLDFVARRSFTPPVDNENITATFLSISTLTGRVYSANILSSLLADTDATHPDAHFIRNYYRLIAGFLQTDFDSAVVDEARIMALASSLCEPHEISTKVTPDLSDLVEWLLVRLQSNDLHPLLVVGIFLYQFMAQDTIGNFREEVMHLLTLALLRRCGCLWLLQYTPVRIMARDRVAYLRAVRSHSNSQSAVSSWLLYWIESLYAAAESACKAIAPEMPRISPSYVSPLNERQLRILRFIGQNHPVRLAAITRHLHKESVNTIKKDLLHLRKLGYILTDGVPKAMLYYKS